MSPKKVIQIQAIWMATDRLPLNRIKRLAKRCSVRLSARLKVKIATKTAKEMGITS